MEAWHGEGDSNSATDEAIDLIYDHFDALVEAAKDRTDLVDALNRRRAAFDKIGAGYNPKRTREGRPLAPVPTRCFVVDALMEAKG